MQRKSKILSLILSLVFIFAIGLTACGGGGSSDEPASSSKKTTSTTSASTTSNSSASASSSSSSSSEEDDGPADHYVLFWGDGDETEQAVFQDLTKRFNAAHKGDIFVEYVPQPNGVTAALEGGLGTDTIADVFYVGDGNYKKYVEAGYVADITQYVESSSVINTSDMWPSIYNRYYYSVENHRAGANAQNGKWYGLPKDIGPTVLYYNADWFNNAGVYIISCYEEDLEDFNNGGYDTLGNTKSKVYDAEFNNSKSISGTVPAKGFFQDKSGEYFFNNKIAMNWDEIRTLSLLLEANRMSGVTDVVKGYHTEWWFNYGWTVGGDCIEYVETSDAAYTGGFYDFTLVDDTKNFIVADDCAAGVTVNGTHYNAGEIISYNDKLTNEEAIAGVTTRASQAIYDTAVTTGVTNGTILELPSQRDAFIEFVLLSSTKDVDIEGKNGYDICFQPTAMGGDGAKTNGFQNQTVGMLVDGRWNVTNFRTSVSFNWDVAPLPIYKEYNSDGSVKVHGITAGHSGSVSLSINSHSYEIEAAWKFVEFIAGPEGQTAQSLSGFAIPSQMSIATDPDNGPFGGGVFINQKSSTGGLLPPFNAEIFLEAAMCEHEGDWSYLKTGSAWIDDWADDLNSKVRNNTMSFEGFINGPAFQNTYTTIKEYTKK